MSSSVHEIRPSAYPNGMFDGGDIHGLSIHGGVSGDWSIAEDDE